MHYQARTVAGLNTVINLTNHNYFNLAGEDSFPGSAYGQFVQMNANRYLPTDATQIPHRRARRRSRARRSTSARRTPSARGSSDVTAPDNSRGHRGRASC